MGKGGEKSHQLNYGIQYAALKIGKKKSGESEC